VSPDAELVARCLTGDRSALRELVERFERPVLALCLRMLRHRQDAEDAAQESLLRVCRHLGAWDGARSLLPWVLAIAGNRCRTALERRGKRPRTVDALADPEVAPCRDDDGELGEEVARAVAGLRDDYRRCFVMYYERGLSLQEISVALQAPEGTIKTWLHRARKQVAEHLRNRGYEEDP